MLETPSMHQYALRENLSAAVNQQGRPEREPSTTERPAPKRKRVATTTSEGFHYDAPTRGWKRTIKDGHAWCTDCLTWKSVTEFCSVKGRPYHYCKVCQRLHKAMSRYSMARDDVVRLYAKSRCDCCGSRFKNQQHKHLHHVGGIVRGVVCLTCNHLLRDESVEHLQRLECCVRFIKDRVKI
jgi:hypothetical protein